jgi:signal transduction histidine kinase
MKRPKLFDTGALSDTTSRRLLNTPSYFFVIWRWSMWLYALIATLGSDQSSPDHYFNPLLALILFAITLGQTLFITLYAPVIRVLFPHLVQRKKRSTGTSQKDRIESDIANDKNVDELLPFIRSHNRHWNILVYAVDVIVCGLVMYLSAPFSDPPFGAGSVFYRYGLSTVLAAASAHGYRGGLVAAFGYDFFAVLGLIVPAPGFNLTYFSPTSHHNHILDILTSVIDAPIIAILVGYFISLIKKYALIALDNIRLTERLVQLAADAERARIAREIHDGIAQLVYMLSLNAETCQAQALRLAEASEEDAELVAPLADRLGRLVTISKQALWETRNYMFSLKPLMSGMKTLTQTLTNQLREFESISDLTTTIEIIGEEEQLTKEKRREQHYEQVCTALFRILQETLTNIYKHAGATQIHVQLQFQQDRISLEVRDNGHGFPENSTLSDESIIEITQPSIYSGRGLRGMQERAVELGGKVSIHPHQTSGTIVSIELPL